MRFLTIILLLFSAAALANPLPSHRGPLTRNEMRQVVRTPVSYTHLTLPTILRV